jgi:hypothetical protein
LPEIDIVLQIFSTLQARDRGNMLDPAGSSSADGIFAIRKEPSLQPRSLYRTLAVGLLFLLGLVQLVPAAEAACICWCWQEDTGGPGSPFRICERTETSCPSAAEFSACCESCKAEPLLSFLQSTGGQESRFACHQPASGLAELLASTPEPTSL